MKEFLNNLKETEKFSEEFISQIKQNPKEAFLVCLSGDLGAGKTTLVKDFAKVLGVKENITSPTFNIMKIYKLPLDKARGGKANNYKLMYHIDAYRLKNGEELLPLGFKEILQEKDNIIFLEWPENVKNILPLNNVTIYLKVIDGNKREVKVVWPKKQKKIKKS